MKQTPKNSITLKLKFNHPNAKLPSAQREGDAAYDIYCVEDVVLPVGRVTKIRTGLVFADLAPEETREDEFVSRTASLDPCDCFGNERRDSPTPSAVFPKVEGRGGLASKGIFPVGGIADSNYRGELFVSLANLSGADYSFNAGDRIAQLMFYKIIAETPNNKVHFEQVHEVLTETVRGANGFGSSGT